MICAECYFSSTCMSKYIGPNGGFLHNIFGNNHVTISHSWFNVNLPRYIIKFTISFISSVFCKFVLLYSCHYTVNRQTDGVKTKTENTKGSNFSTLHQPWWQCGSCGYNLMELPEAPGRKTRLLFYIDFHQNVKEIPMQGFQDLWGMWGLERWAGWHSIGPACQRQLQPRLYLSVSVLDHRGPQYWPNVVVTRYHHVLAVVLEQVIQTGEMPDRKQEVSVIVLEYAVGFHFALKPGKQRGNV